MRSWGWGLHDGISILGRRGGQLLSVLWGQQKGNQRKLGRSIHGTQRCWPPDLRYLSLQNYGKGTSVFKPPGTLGLTRRKAFSFLHSWLIYSIGLDHISFFYRGRNEPRKHCVSWQKPWNLVMKLNEHLLPFRLIDCDILEFSWTL